MMNDVEIIKEGLSYEDELRLVAGRFEMTEDQAMKSIIHEIYMSGVNVYGLKALEIIDECDYNGDGSPVEEPEFLEDELPF